MTKPTPGAMRATPGPWKVLESKGGSFFIYSLLQSDSEGACSPIKPMVRVPKRSTIEMRANARLMAASWAMLEALIAERDANDDESWQKAKEMARAAISAATGEGKIG